MPSPPTAAPTPSIPGAALGDHRAAAVRLLVTDVDGVLTDGSIMLDDDGRELKRFCAADGLGLRTWGRMGLTAAVITARSGTALLHRLAGLGVAEVAQGSGDKRADLIALSKRTGIPPAEIAYIGDDWPDLPALRTVGYPIAVANAAKEVKAAARLVTRRRGGDGAVREAVEFLLASKGLLSTALRLYDPTYGVEAPR
jgi:3-deoxy-D-manno-octulosonate 8-phosphate phosphatase (KDO 8-P phosphatase)